MIKIGLLMLTIACASGWLLLADGGQSHLLLRLIGAIVVSYAIFVVVLLATAEIHLHHSSHKIRPSQRARHGRPTVT